MRWTGLEWSGGAAANFHEHVARPFRRFLTTADIDVWAALEGLALPWRTGAQAVRAALDRRLFHGATLQDLPAEGHGPRFVLLATNYQLNSPWRFSRAYAADYRVGMVRNPRFTLAEVAAASAGFPPFFAPACIELGARVSPLFGGPAGWAGRRRAGSS